MVFFILFMTVWGGGHLYIAHRLIRPLSPGSRWRLAGWLVLLASLLLVPVVFFGSMLTIDPVLLDALAWTAYLDMGFFLILVPVLIARDMGLVITASTGAVRRWLRRQRDIPATADTERRLFLTNTMNFGLIGLTGGMTVAGYHEARRLARVKEVTIPVADLPSDLQDFRIVQLSDIHLGPTIKGDYLQGIVERTNALEPDLVAITGDLVDGFTYLLEDEVTPLKELRSHHGTFFVTGNHEYYWGAEAWTYTLRSMGLTVLLNENHMIRQGDGRLLMSGVTDYSAHRFLPSHASDPRHARRYQGRADVSVLLAHQPKSAFAAAAAGYDLQLSGHVHGGQFFPWNLFIGLVQPFTKGLHRVDDRMWLYVSTGTGYWGPPVRLGVPAEISLIQLTRG